jgi:hypothetical protein
MAYTFGAEDILAALGVTATDWEVQESGSDRQQDHAQTKDNAGNVIADSETAYNDRSEKTLTIKSKVPAGAVASFSMGGIGTTNVVITAFSAKETYNDNGTLSVTAHKHETIESGAAHLAAPAAVAVSLTLGFGVLAPRLNGTAKDCQSSEVSGAMEHVDKLSNAGKFLVGASTGIRYECTEEYVDSGSDIAPAAPWVLDGQAKKSGNGDFYTRTVKAHAYSLS